MTHEHFSAIGHIGLSGPPDSHACSGTGGGGFVAAEAERGTDMQSEMWDKTVERLASFTHSELKKEQLVWVTQS